MHRPHRLGLLTIAASVFFALAACSSAADGCESLYRVCTSESTSSSSSTSSSGSDDA